MNINNKASGNLTYIYMFVAITMILFGGLTYVLNEVDNKNTILTDTSRASLDNFNGKVLAEIPADSIQLESSDINITSGSGEEDFSREFRESKAASEVAEPSLVNIYKVPGLFVSSAGIQQDDQVNFYLTIIGFTLAFIVGLAIYIAWKTGEVKNR